MVRSYENNVNILFVNAGYMVGGFAPRLEHMVRCENYIKGEERLWKRVHVVFCTIVIASGAGVKHRFVLFSVRNGVKKMLWL